MNYTTFNTERLHLRPATLNDASFILELLNMPKWIQYIGDRNVHSITDAENYIKERMMPQLERLGYGNYTVVRKEDGALMGCCGLYNREGLEGVDIGFSFLPQYEKKGYAYEASRCLLDGAFAKFDLDRVGAITLEENTSSRRLLEKLELKFVKMITLETDDTELMYYEITR
ncbi:N-acetyltransferase [Dokdonia sinensis]|uniref:N-acetyltransferase n=1 Tax=Dokdonia sinensis TaxID=2479847 RepID=A0A3M0H0W3_9FLAO|nr:GNAT family N-acetyltransferase [Dokdonia sinensis]RMB63226.1 N-acetyltransferase [Dokdonia sinensis]